MYFNTEYICKKYYDTNTIEMLFVLKHEYIPIIKSLMTIMDIVIEDNYNKIIFESEILDHFFFSEREISLNFTRFLYFNTPQHTFFECEFAKLIIELTNNFDSTQTS